MKRRLVWLSAALLLAASSAGARDLEDILKEKNVIDSQEANEVKAAKERSSAPALPPLPDWVSKVTLSGDVRIRNELFLRDGDPDRNRDRFRLRFGLKAKPNDETEIGFRVASGVSTDPISNNQTFSDTFTFKSINISNAYAKLSPASSFGWARPYFSLMGGKFDVPTYTATNLMFDRDLTPEGFFETVKPIETTDGFVRGLAVNFGQWIFQENANTGESAIYAFQGVTNLALGGGVFANLGFGDYKYVKPSTVAVARNKNTDLNITNFVQLSDKTIVGGRKIDPTKFGPKKDGFAAPTVDADGKTVPGKAITITNLISEYNVMNVGGDVTIATGMPAFPIKVYADYIVNTDANGAGSNDDTGYQFGASIGADKDPGDALLGYAYQHLETDATVSAFSDSDFGRDGGTNTEGHILKASYVLIKNLSLVSTAWITEPINDVSGRNSNTDYRWQIDMIAKF